MTIDERAIAVANETMAAANYINAQLQSMPKTGKRGRNIFLKTYNRRPMNAKKRNKIIALTAIKAVSSAVSIAIIMSTPIPKFKKGTP